MESNPLTPEAVAALLEGLPASSVSALGLDEGQLDQLPLAQRERLVTAAGPKLRVSRIVPPPGGSGGAPGYFKLDLAPPAAAAAGNGSSRPSTEVLVVSFGSAPGTPNWGGLLKKVRAAAATPQVRRSCCSSGAGLLAPPRLWGLGGRWPAPTAPSGAGPQGLRPVSAPRACPAAPPAGTMFSGAEL